MVGVGGNEDQGTNDEDEEAKRLRTALREEGCDA